MDQKGEEHKRVSSDPSLGKMKSNLCDTSEVAM